MNIVTFTMRGVSPLLMHNSRLADPLDEWTIKIAEYTGKNKKTADDHREISKLEWIGGIYHEKDRGLVIPSANVIGLIHLACKLRRKGKQALAGVSPTCVSHDLIYDGPKSLADLWADGRFLLRKSMRLKDKRLMRSRAIVPEWALSPTVRVNPRIIDPKTLKSIMEDAGLMIGFGDGKPVYGRFTVGGFKIS